MDIPCSTSPSSIRVHDPNPGFERRYSRTSQRISPSSFSSRGFMPIPNARSDPAPPPLPPPTFIPDLARGHDAAWQFGNDGYQRSILAPIKLGSSLHGGYMQPKLNTRSRSEDQPEQLDIHESNQKSNRASTIHSPSQPEVQRGCLSAADEDRQKTASPSTMANQRCVYLLFVNAYYTSRSPLSLHLFRDIATRFSPSKTWHARSPR